MPAKKKKLIGPFCQLLTMADLPLKGTLSDDSLEIIENAGVLVENGHVAEVGGFEELRKSHHTIDVDHVEGEMVCLPGFIDAHTHMCFAGSRARDYALRNAGKSYLEIARQGGGIWDTVTKTREATQNELEEGLKIRAEQHFKNGITTAEVKSGYGLNVLDELKMLRAIKAVDGQVDIDLVGTCLAAHMRPKDFQGSSRDYITHIIRKLLPQVLQEGLSNRIDVFIEDTAFTPQEALQYLTSAKEMGFDLTVHADQFSAGGSEIAIRAGALSADHLEASTEKEIAALGASNVVAMALPGASIGLGCKFTPARQLLDMGACVAIATDWNPGSAPMGDLLMQAAVLGASEKLSGAEVFAAITFRAAAALNLNDRGRINVGKKPDLVAFPCNDYREILYQQGSLKPSRVWKNG